MQKVAFIAICALLISGCSVFRHESKITPGRESSFEITRNSIIENNLTAENFNIQKAEILYIEDGTTINIIASLKHRSEGKFLISLKSRSGIEIARIFITKDTVLVNDRMNKKLYCGSSDYLEKKYGITTGTIPLLFGDMIADTSKKILIECKGGKSEIIDSISSKNIIYNIDCNKKKVADIKIEGYSGESRIEIKLGDFQNLEEKVFPTTIELMRKDNNSEIRIRIKKIEFNSEEKLIFIPGTNYEKIVIR